MTGEYAIPTQVLTYDQADCTGSVYAQFLNPIDIPFAEAGLAAPGRPLYSLYNPASPVAYRSMSDGQGGCTVQSGTMELSPAVGVGAVPGASAGPLRLSN